MSRVAKSGWSRTCHTMAGTPPKVVMDSRSISSRARPASHLYMITIFPPKNRLATRTEWQPVAWKNGHRQQVGVLVAGAGGGVRRQRGIGGPRRGPGLGVAEAHQVGADVAVRPERALGAAGRARRVEDRRVGLGVDGHVGERHVGAARRRGPRRTVARRRGARAGLGPGDDHGPQRREVLELVLEPRGPLAVGEEHDRARVARGRTPARGRSTTRSAARPRRRPRSPPRTRATTREVPHGDGDPVALGTPKRSRRIWARWPAAAACSAKVRRSSSYTRNTRSPWARLLRARPGGSAGRASRRVSPRPG